VTAYRVKVNVSFKCGGSGGLAPEEVDGSRPMGGLSGPIGPAAAPPRKREELTFQGVVTA
jgi:hypothetical protein